MGKNFEKNIGQRSRVCFPLRLNCGEKKRLDYKMQRSHFSDSESIYDISSKTSPYKNKHCFMKPKPRLFNKELSLNNIHL